MFTHMIAFAHKTHIHVHTRYPALISHTRRRNCLMARALLQAQSKTCEDSTTRINFLGLGTSRKCSSSACKEDILEAKSSAKRGSVLSLANLER